MTEPSGDTGRLNAYSRIAGNSVGEKCESLGVIPGELIPLSRLKTIHEQYGIAVYLFFDERIARSSTMQDDIVGFSVLPPKARPYLEIEQFYRVIEEEGLLLLEDDMVSAEIIAVGKLECASCVGVRYDPYIRALLPPNE